MSFDLDFAGAERLLSEDTDGSPMLGDTEPGFMAGTAQAPLRGVFRGLVAKPAVLASDALTPFLRGPARAVDEALGTDLDARLEAEQRKTRDMLGLLKPDPRSVGLGASVADAVFDFGSSILLYGPATTAILEGYGRKTELEAEGVDETTATAAGAASGALTYGGIRLPLTLGSQAARTVLSGGNAAVVGRNILYGAGSNVSLGVGERGATAELLERAGYPEQAKQYAPFDRATLAVEAVLGAAFSGAGAAAEVRSGATLPRVNRDEIREAVRAALAVRKEAHAAVDTAPGAPVDGKAAAAHAQALDAAIEALAKGEPVSVPERVLDADFVRRTDTNRAEVRSAIIEEISGRPMTGVRADIYRAAEASGVDPGLALAVAEIDADTRPRAGPGASEAPASARGGTETAPDRSALSVQPERLVAGLRSNADQLGALLDRVPTLQEQFIAHMLGPQVAARVLQAPADAPLVGVLPAKRRKASPAVAKPDSPDETVGQALRRWQDVFERTASDQGFPELAPPRNGAGAVERDSPPSANGPRFSDRSTQTVREDSGGPPGDAPAGRGSEPADGSRLADEAATEPRALAREAFESDPDVQAAQAIAEADPEMLLPLEDGTVVRLADLLTELRREVDEAESGRAGYLAAAECFLRTGG